MAKRKPAAPAGSYRVIRTTSVRLSTDPDHPDWHKDVTFEAGSVATSWPDHTDVKGLVEVGAWEPVEEGADGQS